MLFPFIFLGGVCNPPPMMDGPPTTLQNDWKFELSKFYIVNPDESPKAAGTPHDDEPYLVVLGFRSSLWTSGSTEVLLRLVEDTGWAEDDRVVDIPESVGVIWFPGVQRRTCAELDLDPTGMEIVGAVVIAMEEDGTPWYLIRSTYRAARDELKRQLVFCPRDNV